MSTFPIELAAMSNNDPTKPVATVATTGNEKKEADVVKPQESPRTCGDLIIDNIRVLVFGTIVATLLILFSVATAFSYKQAETSSVGALAYDDRSLPGDTNQWYLFPIKYVTFIVNQVSESEIHICLRVVVSPSTTLFPFLCRFRILFTYNIITT